MYLNNYSGFKPVFFCVKKLRVNKLKNLSCQKSKGYQKKL